MFKLRKCFGHLRVVCPNTNTHEIEKDADEPSPLSKKFGAWLFETLSTMVTVIALRHDVSSGHRDESKFTEIREHRDESRVRKDITNIETGRKSRKVVTNVETGQKSRKVITNVETDQKSGKIITKIETSELDSDGKQKSRHQRIRAERVGGSKIRAKKMKEFVMSSLMGAREHEGIHGEVPDDQKLNRDDDVTRLRPSGCLTQDLTPM